MIGEIRMVYFPDIRESSPYDFGEQLLHGFKCEVLGKTVVSWTEVFFIKMLEGPEQGRKHTVNRDYIRPYLSVLK